MTQPQRSTKYRARILAVADRWLSVPASSPFVKAAFAVVAISVPLFLDALDLAHKGLWIGGFTVAAFFFYWLWEFAPDRRFEVVREPTLDAWFDKGFADLTNALKDERMPFRIHIMEERGLWPRPSFLDRCQDGWWNRLRLWHRLQTTYTYNVRNTDADHGLPWFPGHGVCWHVFAEGRSILWRRDRKPPEDFGLTDVESRRTKDVTAVLCLPIRSARLKMSGRPPQHKPDAVLCIDSLTEAGADLLAEMEREYQKKPEGKVPGLISLPELYFG